MTNRPIGLAFLTTRRHNPFATLLAGLCCLATLLAGAAAARTTEALPSWMEEPFTTPAEVLSEDAQAIPSPADAHVIILFDDISHRFDASGRHALQHRRIYRLLTPNGVDGSSTVGAQWTPWYQETPEIRARVLTADGEERWLDPTTLNEAPLADSSPDLFDDRRILQAPLPGVGVGSLVVWEVIVRDRQPFFAAGTYHRDFLINPVPTHRIRLSLEAPTSLPLRYGLRLADDVETERQVVQVDGQDMARLVFSTEDRPAAEDPPPNLPYHQPRFPSVIFSTGDSWNRIASAYDEIIDDKLANADLTEVLVGFPVGGERQEMIDFLLAQVQKTVRYTGLELGAASIIPVTPAELLERKFGDCKDQATLLVALLRQVGIPAHVALLRADFGDDIEPQLPGLGFFNHAIVHLPGERPLWIDPTDPFARAGELPLVDQGRWALVADAATQTLIPTPTSNSVDNRLVEQREIFMADYGEARVVETGTYFGSFERYQRQVVRSADADSMRQALSNYVENEYLAEALESSEVSPFDDLEQPLTLRLVATGIQRGSTDLAEGAVALTYGDLFSEVPAALMPELEEDDGDDEEAARQDDFIFYNPFVKEWHYQIHLPVGFVPRDQPADRSLKLGGMVYEERFTHQPGLVTADLRLDSGLRRLSPEQFEATRKGLDELAQSDITILNFDHQGASLLAAGRSREAIEVFHRLALEHPEQAIHRVRLANALLGLGMGREAQRQARLAVEAEPDSALAHWILGFSLAHDEMGRAHHSGFDLDAALDALQKAHELEPSNSLFLAELAILLDFDADGRRYGHGADLDEAVTRYRQWRQDHGNGLDDNLLNTLYQSGRWQDIYDLAQELPDDAADRQTWRLTALGALEGSEAVLKAARRLGKDAAQQVLWLQTAAGKLTAAGMFATASDLLRHIAGNTENPAATLRLAEMLAATRPTADLDLSADDPVTPIHRFFISVLDEASFPDALRQIYHPLSQESLSDELLEAIPEVARNAMIEAGDPMSIEQRLQLLFTILDISIEGDAATGYRLRNESRLPGFEFLATSYVRNWQGEARLVALGEDLSALAAQALDLLDSGHLPAARQWLDWARDHVERQDTDDPLVGDLFARLWKKGQEADAETLRLAADLLLIRETLGSAPALERIQQRLAATDDPQQQQLLHLALANRASMDRDWSALDVHSRWLFEAQPESGHALFLRVVALEQSRQEDALRRLAEERLETDSENTMALLALANQHLRRDEPVQAFERLARIAQGNGSKRERANALNSWAWAKLFQRPVDDEVLSLATKSAELRNYQSYAILHTLAMAYAEADRPFEAYRILQQAISVRSTPDLEGEDLLVVGRIAQSYGLMEAAREAYARLEKPEDAAESTSGTSSWHLAQILLAEMDADGK